MPALTARVGVGHLLRQPSVQIHATCAPLGRYRRYVPSPDEIPCPDKPLGESGTERSGAHNAHNHPSGIAEPSQADELITHRLRDALGLVEIRVLDHLIVGGNTCLSFAERGLL